MSKVLITVVWHRCGMAQNKKRDASSLKIIATAAGHLQNIELEDPAVLRILEVIAGKVNETEQCAFMENSKCHLFISKALVTSSRLESRAVGETLRSYGPTWVRE